MKHVEKENTRPFRHLHTARQINRVLSSKNKLDELGTRWMRWGAKRLQALRQKYRGAGTLRTCLPSHKDVSLTTREMIP